MIGGSPSLLDHDVDLIAVLHLKAVRRVIVLDSLSVEDEAALVVGETLSLAVSVHQLFQLGGPFDLEEDLSPILGFHLDVDVLVLRGCSISWS